MQDWRDGSGVECLLHRFEEQDLNIQHPPKKTPVTQHCGGRDRRTAVACWPPS